MTDRTIGQRIAERRKMLNLSQEALGEKMGVSRQAISKWEADAAVPEIDKLIAMSKLFSVSVGWLLGTEPEAAAAEPKDSFTEEQLRMVEEIVKRYQPQKKEQLSLSIIVGILVFVLVGIIAAMLVGNYVNRELGSIWAQMNSSYANYIDIRSKLDELSSRLDVLAQGEQLLSEYTLEAVAWDDMTGAVIRFTAIPKKTGAGEQAWLSVRRNGEEVANAMCVMDGSAYTATVDLPAADGYSFYFQVVQTGGDSAQQKLNQADSACIDLRKALNGTVFCDLTGWSYSWNSGAFGADLLVNRIEPLLFREGTDVTWTRIDLVVLRNGEEIERRSYLEDFSAGVIYEEDGVVHVQYPNAVEVRYECSLSDLADTDKLTLQLEYSFGSNQISVQPIIDIWMEDGEPKVEEYAMIADP